MMFGGGGGRRMLRIVGRAATSCSVPTVSPTLSSSNTSSYKLIYSSSDNNNNNNSNSPVSLSSNSSVSSSSSSAHTNNNNNNNNLLNAAFAFSHSFYDTPHTADDDDWAFVNNNYDYDYGHDDVDDGGGVSSHLFSGVPSEAEVDHALSALHQVFGPASHSQLVRDKCDYKSDNESDDVIVPGLADQVISDESEPDWKEPSLFAYNSKVRNANGFDRVNYAFHLLQTEPYVQRMVKSLSSDKAVWDAVLNNEVVRELREISADKEHILRNSDDTHTTRNGNVVMWIFDTAKAKFIEVIEIITKAVIELFRPAYHNAQGGSDPINDNLRTAFMLSIMVLLVVVVGRGEARA